MFWVLLGSLLSYGPLSPLEKLWVGLGGLMASVVWTNLLQPRIPTQERPLDPWPSPGGWVVGLVVSTGLFLRFDGLVAFHGWPLEDEGMAGYLAMGLSRHWRWEVFPFFSQIPPLYYWGLGLFFKLVPPALGSFWLFPALLSAAALGAAFWATRQWLEPKGAFWAAALWAVSFWPAFISRFGHPVALVPFWEITGLGLFGWWRRALGTKGEAHRALVLGVWIGAGFWTTFHWPFVAALLVVAFGVLQASASRKRPGVWILFVGGILVPLVPLAVASWDQEFGRYARNLLGSREGYGLWDHLLEGSRYIASIFWSGGTSGFGYRPIWGGYLNPVLGALVFAGLWGMVRQHRWRRLGFIGAGISLGLLPGFLTLLTEFLRTAHGAPFFLMAAFFGLASLLETLPARRRKVALALVLSSSVLLDGFHLEKAIALGARIDRPWTNGSRSESRARAFAALERLDRDQGPGAVLVDFAPDAGDQSLALAIDRWNQAVPGADISPPRWWAVYLEQGFAEALAKRLPSGQVIPLAEDLRPGPPMALFVQSLAGVPPSGVKDWRRWAGANQEYRRVVQETIAHKEGRGRVRILQALQQAQTVSKGDPVLEALEALRISEFYHVQAIAAYYHPEILGPGDPVSLRVELLREEAGALERSVQSLDAEPARGYLMEARQVLGHLDGKSGK